jgi:hypothetical protein
VKRGWKLSKDAFLEYGILSFPVRKSSADTCGVFVGLLSLSFPAGKKNIYALWEGVLGKNKKNPP